jgi:hemoglobin
MPDAVATAAAVPAAPPITEAEIGTLVDRFYAKARRDALIGPLFNAAVENWDEHLATLRAFWSSVMLTSGRYKGNPMAAHLRHEIRPEFFDRWLALWGETVGEIFAPDIASLFRVKAARIAESLKLAILYKAGSLEPVRLREPERRRGGIRPSSE